MGRIFTRRKRPLPGCVLQPVAVHRLAKAGPGPCGRYAGCFTGCRPRDGCGARLQHGRHPAPPIQPTRRAASREPAGHLPEVQRRRELPSQGTHARNPLDPPPLVGRRYGPGLSSSPGPFLIFRDHPAGLSRGGSVARRSPPRPPLLRGLRVNRRSAVLPGEMTRVHGGSMRKRRRVRRLGASAARPGRGRHDPPSRPAR